MFDWLISIFTMIISFFSKLFGFSKDSIKNTTNIIEETKTSESAETIQAIPAPVDNVVTSLP